MRNGVQTSLYLSIEAAEVLDAIHAHLTAFAHRHGLPTPSKSHSCGVAIQAAALGMLPEGHPQRERLQAMESNAEPWGGG